MATVTALTLVKKFLYRGDANEEFSNTYHFKGSPPGNDASWDVLTNDVVVLEQKVLDPTVTFVRALGYDSNDVHAIHVYQQNFAIPGPPPTGQFAPPAGAHRMAGDQAFLMRWGTDIVSNPGGKKIYLRKYFHGGWIQDSDPDVIAPELAAAMLNYGELMEGVHGGLRSSAHDLNVVGAFPSSYVTTRTLKRRGKKKKT